MNRRHTREMRWTAETARAARTDDPIAAEELEADPRNPFRPLDWRWRRATLIPEPTTRRANRHDDSWVRHARRFVALRRGEPGAGRRITITLRRQIDSALRLRSPMCHEVRDHLEARLLAGQDDATIGLRLGLEPGVVAAYAALFFDVRPLLEAHDSLLLIGVGPELHDLEGEPRATLRAVAFLGGPFVIDALLGRRGDPEAKGGEGPDPRAVRAFERLNRVRALRLDEIGMIRMVRLWAYATRLDSMTRRGRNLPPRDLPEPDLAALREAAAPTAPINQTERRTDVA